MGAKDISPPSTVPSGLQKALFNLYRTFPIVLLTPLTRSFLNTELSSPGILVNIFRVRLIHSHRWDDKDKRLPRKVTFTHHNFLQRSTTRIVVTHTVWCWCVGYVTFSLSSCMSRSEKRTYIFFCIVDTQKTEHTVHWLG